MMKVIEPGKYGDEKTWKFQIRCTGWGNGGEGCQALVEVEREDLYYYPGSGGTEMTWGYREHAVSFKCPCCGTLTDLGLSDWPKNYKTLRRWHPTLKEK